VNSKQIIEKCSKGNQKAQKAFYNEYIDLLYSTINRYVKDSATVDDLLFQAMMKIFTKLEDFTYINEKALVGWLKKIAVNEALMHLRADFRTLYKIEEISEMDSNNLVEADDLNEKDILETIEKLPAGYRTVFLLHVVEGYSHKEIAVQLGIAEGTSRSQFFKARSLLQQKLKKDYGKEFGT
jgi:RNA polymerase sigma-70 factor (ECF subfamily)